MQKINYNQILNINKREKTFNKNFSIILNIMIFIFSTTGFFLSCIFAKRDGYSHWLKRLLYFTQQSNLWIGITSLIFAIISINKNSTAKSLKIISIFKYIFTVSITITCIIFCAILSPFADFNVWTFASILTHVVVPLLSIFDFFNNKYIVKIDKKYVWLTIITPLIYYIFTSILCAFKIDFGRGNPYPYFFMNFYSSAGLFGFVLGWPPLIGSFYWFIFLLLLIYFLSIVYYKVHTYIKNKKNN